MSNIMLMADTYADRFTIIVDITTNQLNMTVQQPEPH